MAAPPPNIEIGSLPAGAKHRQGKRPKSRKFLDNPMSVGRPGKRKSMRASRDANEEARLEALRDATPEIEPPWIIKTKEKKAKREKSEEKEE